MRESEDMKLAYLFCWPTCFSDRVGWWIPRDYLLEPGAGMRGGEGREGRLEEKT